MIKDTTAETRDENEEKFRSEPSFPACQFSRDQNNKIMTIVIRPTHCQCANICFYENRNSSERREAVNCRRH